MQIVSVLIDTKSVIRNYLKRAYKISNNWHKLEEELDKIKQILVNNNFFQHNH